jgi:hypothetical protein
MTIDLLKVVTSPYWLFGWWSVLSWVVTLSVAASAYWFRLNGLAFSFLLAVFLAVAIMYFAYADYQGRVFENVFEKNRQGDGLFFLLLFESVVLFYLLIGGALALRIRKSTSSLLQTKGK